MVQHNPKLRVKSTEIENKPQSPSPHFCLCTLRTLIQSTKLCHQALNVWRVLLSLSAYWLHIMGYSIDGGFRLQIRAKVYRIKRKSNIIDQLFVHFVVQVRIVHCTTFHTYLDQGRRNRVVKKKESQSDCGRDCGTWVHILWTFKLCF